MSKNFPSVDAIYADLVSVFDKLAALDPANIESACLVPMIKVVQKIAAYGTAIDAQIQLRTCIEGEAIPGVMTDTTKTNRVWNDVDQVTELAYAEYGLKAFKLDSPAAIEKLGAAGKALVAIATSKPEGRKVAKY